MDTYADDLAVLVNKLDLKEAIHVGHSTGGGEVARYLGRHGTKRVAKVVLIGAVPPLMLKTAANPGGDQIVPIADSAMLSAKLVKHAQLKVYQGAPHGLCTTHKEQVNEDLLAFIKS